MAGDQRLDVLHGYAGECAFCGAPDKRHRLADAIEQRARAGESWDSIIDDYGGEVTHEAIQAIVRAYTEARRMHRKLPGR